MTEFLLLFILVSVLAGLAATLVAMSRSSSALADLRRELREELRAAREESRGAGAELRAEVARSLQATGDTLAKSVQAVGRVQEERLEGMARRVSELNESNTASLERIRETLDRRVASLQEGNERKLEEMRRTVDEKLQKTLERRLGESFRLVSDRLEAVHKGLGEMQNLAADVGDLKRVLTNVKIRGTWAEVQLGAILEEILGPERFERNVHVVPGSAEVVEYAVKLPGSRDEPGSRVWLPIDSKFPQEDYLRLQEAAERGDAEAVHKASEQLARAIRSAAAEIREKYVRPPYTTDFAIMFLATEGLYAEALRMPGLAAEIQSRHRVLVAGPTTVAAVLSSLGMGFKTLAIEQRASEVWRILGAVKTEFGKFKDVLARVKKQVETVGRTLEQTDVRTRAMERRLRDVENLPEDEAEALMGPANETGRPR